MSEELTINEALEACLTGPKGELILQWLVEQMLDNDLEVPMNAYGSDVHYEAFRKGGATAYRDILERAGYRITFERKPDERIDGTESGQYDSDDGTMAE